jgi:hypothetical protein
MFSECRQAASSAAESTKRPVDEGAASRNANDVLMLRAQLKSLGERVVIVNKVEIREVFYMCHEVRF